MPGCQATGSEINSHRMCTRKSPATDVSVFVRKNRREILFAKSRQHFAGQQDDGMKHTDRYRIVDGCRFKESDRYLP